MKIHHKFGLKSAFAGSVIFLVMFTADALAQGAADRAEARTDDTRAKTEGRFQRLEQTQQTGRETIVTEETITVPARRSTARIKKQARMLGLESVNKDTQTDVNAPKTKRVVVRRVVTVSRPTPLKINPY